MKSGIPVSFVHCPDYAAPAAASSASALRVLRLKEAVDSAFALARYAPRYGERVLVKPNLVRAHALSCTDPRIVRVVCEWLLDQGARVEVGDSPGFGSAKAVSRHTGLSKALRSLRPLTYAHPVSLQVQGLTRAVTLRVPGLGPVRIARQALEADSILSVPRLKAHNMMGLSCATKNLFGCVCGAHKALAHVRYGDKGAEGRDLCRYIAGLSRLLPPQAALVDAVVCMHVAGPSSGEPYPLGLIAASTSCVAADTAIYGLLGLSPDRLPLWATLREMAASGAFANEIFLQGSPPETFSVAAFTTPPPTRAHSFNPWRLCGSIFRRFWEGLKP